MEKKSRVLIIGATGRLGYQLANHSLKSGHLTFALVRDSAFTDPSKLKKIQYMYTAGATILKGSLQDEEILIEAVKQVDVVICCIPSRQVLEQKLLIEVIKKTGCIKRFIPSEFGSDPDKSQISDIDNNFYSCKSEIRRLVESEGIPYTYICCNLLMRMFLPSLVQPNRDTPPRDKAIVFGDGNTKGIFVEESDVAAFTIATVDDPRTLNKVLYLRPPGNVNSMNELVDIWETKIGKKLEKLFVLEHEVLAKIKETPYPENMEMVFIYSVFVKGDHTYFDINPSEGVEGTELYPQLKYTTVSEYLDTLL